MNEVLARLEEAFPSCVVKMNAMGSRMTLEVTSPIFNGVSRLERQRLVKNVLKPWIDSGELHSVMLKVSEGEVNE